MNEPQVSIVVCTHNRAAMLRDALESLVRLETAARFKYEIVVVDNASIDGTAEVVARVREQSGARIHYVFEGKQGIATARNRGLREASGPWIAFFDDDQLADRRWLLELYCYANDYNLLGVGGTVHLKLPDGCARRLHPFVRMLLGESHLASEPIAYSPKLNPGTGNLMLHRCVFDKIGLFNESFVARAEDTDLFCRIWAAGIETWYVPTAVVHHVTPPERLQNAYLHRLASFMGDGIARRERAARSAIGFLPRGVAKAAFCPLAASCKLLVAWLLGRSEDQLGLGCKLQLANAYAVRTMRILQDDFSNSLPQHARALPSATKTQPARTV